MTYITIIPSVTYTTVIPSVAPVLAFARKHGGGVEESIEKVIVKQYVVISAFYFDIFCSMFDILYVILAKVGLC